jgi:hypothetical protein
MKIVGQSTAANGMPYVHLGYLAATYSKRTHPPALIGGSLAVLALGVMMAFSLVLGKAASGRTTLKFAPRRSRKLLIGGQVFIILGVAGLALSLTYKEEVHYPGYTDENGWGLLAKIEDFRASGFQVPATIQELDPRPDAILDAWGHAMRLVTEDKDGVKTYSIWSAGPDGKFGTSDDRHITRR